MAPGRNLPVLIVAALCAAFGAPFGTVRAQVAPAVPAAAPPVHELRVDASRVAPGQFVYETVLERDASGTPLGTRTVSAQLAPYAGVSSWLLIETRTGDAIPALDSLFADQQTLRPMHWGSTIGRARLSAEFRGDTVYAGTNAPPGRRSMVTTMPPGTLVSSAMLETLLRALPLGTAWEDSTYTLSVSLNAAASLPTRIAVIGEDRVRVPAGQYDCWIVSVRAGDSARGLYWVTKRDPMVVRSALEVPGMNGAQYVSSLSRASR